MNRKKIMELIIGTYNRLDESGEEAKRMKSELEGLSNKQFEAYMKAVSDPKEHGSVFRLYATPFDKNAKSKTSIEKGLNALKFLKIPLKERVRLPHILNKDGVGVLSREVMVVPVHLGLLQQKSYSEGAVAIHKEETDMLTGQPKGTSKAARLSGNMVGSMMVRSESKDIIDETFRFRSGNTRAGDAFDNKIMTDGKVSLKDVPVDVRDNKQLVYANEVLKAMGLLTEFEDHLN